MAEKNWTGNSNSIYKTLGASNHTDKEREENDYYATDPIAAEHLIALEGENFFDTIWEPACGEGHLSDVFKKAGYSVLSSDLIDRGYPDVKIIDFLNYETNKVFNLDIVTNPPYKYAKEFVEKSLELVEEGRLVCMFLKIQFLEGKKRKELFQNNPPKRVWVSSSRITCAKNADFEKMKKDIQEIADDFINRGHDVHITTSRHESWKWKGTNSDFNKDLFQVAEELGILKENIHFTEMEPKVDFLDGFDMHFDDDEVEIDLITRSEIKCLGILINYKNYNL